MMRPITINERRASLAKINALFVAALLREKRCVIEEDHFAKAEEVPQRTFTVRLPFINTDIVRGVATAFGIDHAKLTGGCRKRNTANAKRVAATLLRDNGLSYKQIARHLGLKDHTSAMYYVESYDEYVKHDPYLASVSAAFKEGLAA